MGIEVVGFEMAQAPTETVTEKENLSVQEKASGKLDKESGPRQPIKFGSHEEEPIKGDGNGAVEVNAPMDAVDEWPAPKQTHSFYFVRYRPFDDPKLKAGLGKADKEIQTTNQSRSQIMEKLRAKRSEKSKLVDQLMKLKNENVQYKTILEEKNREIRPLQEELGKLRDSNSGRYGLCSSKEELDDLINSLQYRIQHESISLTEEKQILKDIKQLEGTRAKVIENAGMRAKLQESLGKKEAIQDQVKLMGVNLDEVKKEKEALFKKIQKLDEEIKPLQVDLQTATTNRDRAFDSIKQLRSELDKENAHFYQSSTTTNEAKKLAAEKNVKAVDELSYREVEKFMSLWSNDKAFREGYKKRILSSLDSRQLSRDGRMRNPDEKPLVAVKVPIPAEQEPVVKTSIKQPKEEPKPTPPKDASIPNKDQKETNKTDSQTPGNVDSADQQISGLEKQQKNPSPAVKEVDEAKLKELRREAEIEKAKQALERKKKLAEKAAAKAAIRAEKEAEKKLKEHEKKLRKKAAASTPATDPEPEEQAEAVVAEPENFEAKDEAPVPAKEKIQKEVTLRQMNRPRGGPDSVPKAILRRKKSTNYWMWAAPAAFFVLSLLTLAYYNLP